MKAKILTIIKCYLCGRVKKMDIWGHITFDEAKQLAHTQIDYISGVCPDCEDR